jgi:hypothetical protein
MAVNGSIHKSAEITVHQVQNETRFETVMDRGFLEVPDLNLTKI